MKSGSVGCGGANGVGRRPNGSGRNSKLERLARLFPPHPGDGHHRFFAAGDHLDQRLFNGRRLCARGRLLGADNIPQAEAKNQNADEYSAEHGAINQAVQIHNSTSSQDHSASLAPNRVLTRFIWRRCDRPAGAPAHPAQGSALGETFRIAILGPAFTLCKHVPSHVSHAIGAQRSSARFSGFLPASGTFAGSPPACGGRA